MIYVYVILIIWAGGAAQGLYQNYKSYKTCTHDKFSPMFNNTFAVLWLPIYLILGTLWLIGKCRKANLNR